jgi:diguanylate cyclase (GGDEF)-like protein
MRVEFDSGHAMRGLQAQRSILVVEHEVLVAHRIRSSLIQLGYDVPPIAASASEALAAVEIHRPDLVLMDVGLEEGDDGIAAAAAIRARHPTPIVFLTAHSDDATLQRAQEEAQPHGYVHKPYQDVELRAAVEVALQRHALEQEVSQQRWLLAGVLSGMSDPVVAADVDGSIVLVNEAGRRAFGETGFRAESRTHGLSGRSVYLPDGETLLHTEQLPLARALAGESVRDIELFVRSIPRPEGRFYSVNSTPLLDTDGIVHGAVEVWRDVTELRAAHTELQQQSQTDALTGAYNRRGFMHVARNALESAHRTGRKPAVFFIDLNGMKRVNDSLGHPEGDRLLTDLTWILRACFRVTDIVGRLGGDEFVVLAPDAGEHADVLRERLRTAVDQFNAASERLYRISVSIGLSRCDPVQPASLEELVEQADRRMYEDKLLRNARRAGAAPEVARSRGYPSSAASAASQVVSAVSERPPLACVRPPRPASVPPPALAGQGQMTPKRLLLVDDEPGSLALLEALLAPLGHEVIRAEDSPSALSAFAERKPDLVLLDMVLSGMSGLDLLTQMRVGGGPNHVPIIVLTAHSEREHRLRGLEAGADDFFEKPADGRSLRARVSTLLQLKESRDALRRLNGELELRNNELRRLQREQRELTAFIVHDLKSPLAAVWSNLEFAQEQSCDDRSEVKESLEDARLACRRLRSMIDDLLVISRLEESQFPLRNEYIELADLLRDVFGDYVRQAANKHVEILGMPQTSARFKADRALLQRVIENILDNSLRHTPEYGRIAIASRANGEIEIAVSNSGPAIPPSDRQRIFEKFARADENASTRANTGLGLYFCKRAIEALGGKIFVTETAEWPTSFVLQLPASA